MVYGALPPEMRRTQARLFNDPDSGYDVLVASDAVGMGLNLNIRRIIFHTLTKFENGHRVPISISQIKQIGGALPPSSGLFDLHCPGSFPGAWASDTECQLLWLHSSLGLMLRRVLVCWPVSFGS